VHYKVQAGRLTVDIDRPAGLPGDFVWQGVRHTLKAAHSHFTLPR